MSVHSILANLEFFISLYFATQKSANLNTVLGLDHAFVAVQIAFTTPPSNSDQSSEKNNLIKIIYLNQTIHQAHYQYAHLSAYHQLAQIHDQYGLLSEHH